MTEASSSAFEIVSWFLPNILPVGFRCQSLAHSNIFQFAVHSPVKLGLFKGLGVETAG